MNLVFRELATINEMNLVLQLAMSQNYLTLFSSICFIFTLGHCLAEEEPLLGYILPKIDQENYKLNPEGDGYTLKLTYLDGSTRNEMVKVRYRGTPEEYLAIMGTNTFLYPGVTATINYTADKNGYIIKYKYEQIPKGVGISAGGLKAAAG